MRQIFGRVQEAAGPSNAERTRPRCDWRSTVQVAGGQGFCCDRITQFIGVIPQSRATQHHHSYEEAIYILEGRGLVWAGDESCEFGTGTSIYLPVGAKHCLENPYSAPVRLLGVFYPSGSPAVNYRD